MMSWDQSKSPWKEPCNEELREIKMFMGGVAVCLFILGMVFEKVIL